MITPMLDQAKLNDMWWAGFCSKAIEHAKSTEPGLPGSEARVQFMQKHLRNDECVDCHNANIMKHLEGLVSKMLGPQHEALFEAGGDIARHMHVISVKRNDRGDISEVQAGRNRFQEALKQVMDTALMVGLIDRSFLEWMNGMAKRYGQPYKAAS